MQLATDNVLIRMPKTKRGTTEIENYYAADVKEAYQVNPPQIIELKALMGCLLYTSTTDCGAYKDIRDIMKKTSGPVGTR